MRDCDVAVNIMFANTKDIGGQAFGQMLLQLPDDPAVIERVLAYAKAKELSLEEMSNG